MKKHLILLPFILFFINLKAQNNKQDSVKDHRVILNEPINGPHPAQLTYGENAIFTAVEHEPEYPGGITEFYKYLAQTIRYPAEDRKDRTQGKVYICFIVEKDGSLSDIKTVRAPSTSLGAEGIRVVSGSPKWIPGTQNGKKVRVQYTVPISFKLN
jgi:periplasmic protein TonB